MIVYDLNGNEYDKDNAMRTILKKYPNDIGSVRKLRDIADHLNYLYFTSGESGVDKWFITDDEEYRKAFKALVIKNK